MRLINATVKRCAVVSVNAIALKCSLMSNDVTTAAVAFMTPVFGGLVLSIASAFAAHGQHSSSVCLFCCLFQVHVLLSCSTHSVLVSCFSLEKQMPPVVCCIFRIDKQPSHCDFQSHQLRNGRPGCDPVFCHRPACSYEMTYIVMIYMNLLEFPVY